jgi:hypothetical protein
MYLLDLAYNWISKGENVTLSERRKMKDIAFVKLQQNGF